MRILILHDGVGSGDKPDALDALVQAREVAAALRALGHEAECVTASLDLNPLVDRIVEADLAFNLVESLEQCGHWIHVVPALVEGLRTPMTGCSSAAISNTSNKLTAKRIMVQAGVPTPEWVVRGDEHPTSRRWIVKAIWEHASLGISARSVVDASVAHRLEDAWDEAETRTDFDMFAERYIEGREFNLSILEIDGAPTVLPPAEIEFMDFAPGTARIVDYAAKWDASSHAYHHTPRRFAFPQSDGPLLEELRALALRCWNLFDLRGYARADFRIDEAGSPWVLEVNTNPCLSADAGFVAAAHEAGIVQRDVVRHIVDAALISRRSSCVRVP